MRRHSSVLLALIAALGSGAAEAAFTSEPVTAAIANEPYVYNVTADGQGNIEIFAVGELPSWLTLSSTGSGTATLSGTPTTPNTTWSVSLRAEDTFCRIFGVFCAVQNFEINVTAPPNRAPVIVPPGLDDLTISVNETVSIAVAPAFSDPDGDALTYSAAGLPAGLTLASDVISGHVSSAQGSPLAVSVTADDGRGGTATASFTLTILPLDRADVRIASIEAEPAPALRQEQSTWRITLENAGPNASGSLELTLDFSNNPLTFEGLSCTASVINDVQRVVCTVAPLAQGQSLTVEIVASAAQRGDVRLEAAIALVGSGVGQPEDPDPRNNTAFATLNVGDALAVEAAQSLAAGAVTALASGSMDGDAGMDIVLAGAAGLERLALTDAPPGLHETLADPADRRRGLAAPALLAADSARDIVLADLDNDSDLDPAIAAGPDQASTAYRNASTGTIEAYAMLGPGGSDDRAIAAGDVDGDGFVDLVVAGIDGTRLFSNSGGAAFDTPLAVAGPATVTDLALVNTVGDALPDLVITAADGPTLVLENVNGMFSRVLTLSERPASSIASGDFNGDARIDLVIGRESWLAGEPPVNTVYLSSAAGGFVPVATLGGSPTLDLATGDIDRDGALDIVAVNATGAHEVFLGNGNGDFTQDGVLLVSPGASRAAIVPIGRAQHNDVLLAGNGGVEVFLNNGEGALGLGDTMAPVIELLGEPEIDIPVAGEFIEPGANASDDIDGSITPTVDNAVDTDVIGTYTVTYRAMDRAGNAALPAVRTVRVNARPDGGGGGGGAMHPAVLMLLALTLAALRGRRRVVTRGPAALLLLLLAAALPAQGSDLSYTYVEFGGIDVDSTVAGTRNVSGQTVRFDGGAGDGLTVAGSLRLTPRFYMAGSYQAAVVDIDATVESPLATETVGGNFDWIATRFAVGWVQPIGERLDFVAGLSYRTVEFDFGSFAGESFDTLERGPGVDAGLRFNPTPAFEFAASVHAAQAAEADLSRGEIDSGTWLSTTARWYPFEDLGLGMTLTTGDVRTLALTIRFGFGELRAGR